MDLSLGTVVALVNLCKTAIELGKWRTALRDAREKDKLSDKEQELLRAAGDDGIFQIVRMSGIDIIAAGNRGFDGDGDNYQAALYWDAFTSLCERGLLRVVGGDSESPLFMLTGQGFELARSIVPTIQRN